MLCYSSVFFLSQKLMLTCIGGYTDSHVAFPVLNESVHNKTYMMAKTAKGQTSLHFYSCCLECFLTALSAYGSKAIL